MRRHYRADAEPPASDTRLFSRAAAYFYFRYFIDDIAAAAICAEADAFRHTLIAAFILLDDIALYTPSPRYAAMRDAAAISCACLSTTADIIL
jgi:hypothetical protein